MNFPENILEFNETDENDERIVIIQQWNRAYRWILTFSLF